MAGSNVWRRRSSRSLLGLCFQLSITVCQHPILHHHIWFVSPHLSFDNHSYSSESPLSVCPREGLGDISFVSFLLFVSGIFPLQISLLHLLYVVSSCFLLYDNTSKASSHFVSFLFQDPRPWTIQQNTPHRYFIIRFLKILFGLPRGNSLLFEKLRMPLSYIAALHLISLWHSASVVG